MLGPSRSHSGAWGLRRSLYSFAGILGIVVLGSSALGTEYLPAIADVDAVLRTGGRVADIGCGLGWSSIGIALAYPDATVDGYDVDTPSIEAARRSAAESGVGDRVRFHVANAATVDARYDVVFAFECIHDPPDPVAVLSAMRGLARLRHPRRVHRHRGTRHRRRLSASTA